MSAALVYFACIGLGHLGHLTTVFVSIVKGYITACPIYACINRALRTLNNYLPLTKCYPFNNAAQDVACINDFTSLPGYAPHPQRERQALVKILIYIDIDVYRKPHHFSASISKHLQRYAYAP